MTLIEDRGQNTDVTLSATIVSFPNQPVALAEPEAESWLADRISEFGPRPVVYPLAYDDDTAPEFEDSSGGSLMARS